MDLTDYGFTAELLGLAQAYTDRIVELVSPRCMAELGDARCGVVRATVFNDRPSAGTGKFMIPPPGICPALRARAGAFRTVNIRARPAVKR